MLVCLYALCYTVNRDYLVFSYHFPAIYYANSVQLKVKFTLEQATKTLVGGRNIALLFL